MAAGNAAGSSSDVSQADRHAGDVASDRAGPAAGTMLTRGVVRAGNWVELECVILPAGERAPGIPDDTARHPFAGRVRGFLVADAQEGDVAQVRTAADRVVAGNLREVMPRNPPDFGNPAPELLSAASQARARLRRIEGS